MNGLGWSSFDGGDMDGLGLVGSGTAESSHLPPWSYHALGFCCRTWPLAQLSLSPLITGMTHLHPDPGSWWSTQVVLGWGLDVLETRDWKSTIPSMLPLKGSHNRKGNWYTKGSGLDGNKITRTWCLRCALTAMGTEAVGTDGGGSGDGESSEDRALDQGRFLRSSGSELGLCRDIDRELAKGQVCLAVSPKR